MKRTGRPPILERRCLERTGVSMTDYYRQCSGKMNIYDAAKSLDVSPNTIYNWLHYNRLEWSSPTDHNREPFRFELNGYRGTRNEHCKRAGVTHSNVRKIMQSCCVSFADGIDIAIARAKSRKATAGIKERIRQSGVSDSNVYQISRDYRCSTMDALEIALARKSAREARHG